MKQWLKTSAVALAATAIFVLLCLPLRVLADAALGDGLKPDVRLLIDISGSMKDSDPENLRAPALDLIVRLLPEGSKAGVWSFGHEVQLLVEHRVIDDAWREAAVRAVAEIDNSGQLTNIPAALNAAIYDFDRLDPSYRTSIILLTDGKVDVSASPMTNARAARALLAEEAPNLGAAGIPVHTIALSDEADWVFLRSLAKTTSGIAEQAQSPEKLTEIFYQSLEMVAPTSRIPLSGQTFQIDESVREFTALIFFDDENAAAGLLDPTGKRFSAA
ncbi:MAG: vWA domain-containing protein, partial [Halioglobus sp.]